MTEFNEAVEAGVRAMFLRTRNGAYASLEFDEIPAEHQEYWRANFAVGFSAAAELLSELAPQSPQYRIRYLPRNSEGEAGIWYTGTAYGFEHTSLPEALEALEGWLTHGVAAKIEVRYVTEWAEVTS